MEKLFLPKGAVIQGERISISHEGDIQIENNLVPLSIKSQAGNILFVPEGQTVHCSHLIAEKGSVTVHGASMNAELISGNEVLLDIMELEVEQAIQAKENTQITGDSVKVADLFSGSLEIKIKGNLIVDSIEVKGELVISAQSLKVNHIKAHKINIEVQDKLEVEHLAAEKDVYVASGSISVKYLDCESFSAAPEVTGIIMVATPEHVKAEGVRGFIRPQEFQVFSKADSFLQISSGDAPKRAPESPSPEDSEKDMGPIKETSDFTAHEPEIVHQEPEPEIVTQPVPKFETLDAEELEPPLPEEPDVPVETEIEEISEASFDSQVEEPEEELEDHESVVAQETELSESHSLDDISMETLNIDDDMEDDFDESFEEEVVLEEEFDMDSVQEEEPEAMDIEHVEGELDSSFATNLDNLSELSDQQEIAMDAIELGDFEDDQSEWEFDQIEETPEAFPTVEQAVELPDEDDEFKTTELNFQNEETPLEVGEMPVVNQEVEQEEPSSEDDFESETTHQEQVFNSDEVESVDLSFGPSSEFISEESDAEVVGDLESLDLADEISDDFNIELPDDTEDALVIRLGEHIGQIKACFPDDNYPKFISQIEVYLNEKRFKILRKKRNREAVISSFDRLENPRISQLARDFYSELSAFFKDDL